MLDLFCVVSDKNMEAATSALLARPKSLGIREIAADVVVHQHHDPGCFHSPEALLNGFKRQASHALVMLDHAWDGVPTDSAETLESELETRLLRLDLAPWAVPIVIYPELESWVWSESPHVDKALGWQGRSPPLRDALLLQDLWPASDPKPPDPKAAVEWAMRQSRIPRSSSIYRQIARRAGTRNCEDRAFRRFRDTLQGWFAV